MNGPAARVTIGMPILNNARTLQRAIDSVRAQSFPDWRLIISDDGSSDGADRIAGTAAAADDRISLVRQPERLGFMNFRAPLDQATTPYFAWLAGDDFWHPEFLTRTLQALNVASAAISALPQAAFIGPPERAIPNLGFLKGTATGRIRRYLAHPGGTRMYGLMRTGPLKAAFPPRPFHAFDWYLVIRLLAQGPQLSLPQTLLYREETPWWHYVEDHATGQPAGLKRDFPILEMSWQLLRDRGLPLGALPALVRLNLGKHEEAVALARPDTFQRRLWLYRRLGLPIAGNPARRAQIAARDGSVGTSVQNWATAERPARGIDVTAILTFRNAARTLASALDHLQALGCQIIAIDHSSTDDSRAIAEARLGRQVHEVIDEPWGGSFDLHRQLSLKRRLIGSLDTGWILHADADEFLDPPEGQDLAGCIARAEASGRIAFPCDELLFLPQHEDEEHDPQSFLHTMTAHVRIRESDAKQRLFRRDADLGLWLRTGGHTVTRNISRLAETHLTLRHYPGLSLDDLRARYLARVFAPDDRARLWHGNRMAAQGLEIVEPDHGLFQSDKPCTVRRLPFLAPRPHRKPTRLPEGADLFLLSCRRDRTDASRLAALLPGLRVAEIDAADLDGMARMVPVLHLLSHPAGLHGRDIQRSLERARAIDWTRQIALARQWAVDTAAVYGEVRAEDLADHPDMSRDRLVRLWQPPVLRGAAGFMAPGASPIRFRPWDNPVLAITGQLAADLGYR